LEAKSGHSGGIAVYYLFRGLRGASGEPVIGRLTAPDEQAAHRAIEPHDIIVEAVYPEGEGGLFPSTLQKMLEEVGVRLRFDQMPKILVGGGIWILDRSRFPDRVMRLADEMCRGHEDRQPALRRIEELLESLYGDRSQAAGSPTTGAVEGRFASADEVRAEMNRLRIAIGSLERELIMMKSRPYVERGESRPAAGRKKQHDRTQDDVLREIFEHNLQLMKLASERTW